MHSHDDSLSDNPSSNPHFNDVLELASPNRRRLITATMGATLASAFQLGPAFAQSSTSKLTVPVPTAPAPKIKMGFKSVNPHFADTLSVPQGYTAKPFFRWGDAISTKSAPFKLDASNTAAEQALQAGMHNDGMHFFPLPVGKEKFSSTRGILCVNHEYADDGLLHTTGFDDWSAEKVAKC